MTIKKTFKMFKEGLSYIFHHDKIRKISLFYFVSSSLIISFLTVILPFMLKKKLMFSNQQYSLVESAFMIGMLIGSLLLGTALSKVKMKSLVKTGLSLDMTAFIILTIILYPFFMYYFEDIKWFYLIFFIVLLMLLGLNDIIYDTPVETYLQLTIPKHLLSRVLATTQLLFGLGIPLGQGLFGILLDQMPIYYLMTFITIIYTLSVLLFLIFVNPSLQLTDE